MRGRKFRSINSELKVTKGYSPPALWLCFSIFWKLTELSCGKCFGLKFGRPSTAAVTKILKGAVYVAKQISGW